MAKVQRLHSPGGILSVLNVALLVFRSTGDSPSQRGLRMGNIEEVAATSQNELVSYAHRNRQNRTMKTKILHVRNLVMPVVHQQLVEQDNVVIPPNH